MNKDQDIVHGTLTSYTRDKCKCIVCIEFWNAYCREKRKKKNPTLISRGRRPRKGEPHFCPKCRVEKTSENTDPYRNGLFSFCRLCAKEYGKEYYSKNAEKICFTSENNRKKRGGRNYNYQKYQGRNFLMESKRRDIERGMANDLTLEFVEESFQKPCTSCLANDMRMTLDRIDNTIGHIQTNVVPSCRRCNYLRRDMPYAAWVLFSPVLQEIHKRDVFQDWSPGPKTHRIRK